MEPYRGLGNLAGFDYHGDIIKSLVYFTYPMHAGDRLEVDPTPHTYAKASRCMRLVRNGHRPRRLSLGSPADFYRGLNPPVVRSFACT